MLSRTTDDYRLMAEAGIEVVCEPAFWLGTDRQYPESHLDYFNHLTTFEPARAAKRGIKHYCFLGVNPKESEDVERAEAVLARIGPYLDRPTVLGIGEIGLNKNTENEIRMLERQLAMAAERRVVAVIHTPHLPEKKRGTEIIADVIRELEPAAQPVRRGPLHAGHHRHRPRHRLLDRPDGVPRQTRRPRRPPASSATTAPSGCSSTPRPTGKTATRWPSW